MALHVWHFTSTPWLKSRVCLLAEWGKLFNFFASMSSSKNGEDNGTPGVLWRRREIKGVRKIPGMRSPPSKSPHHYLHDWHETAQHSCTKIGTKSFNILVFDRFKEQCFPLKYINFIIFYHAIITFWFLKRYRWACPMKTLLSNIFKQANLPRENWASLFLECSWPRQIRVLIFGMLKRAAVFQSPSCFYGIFFFLSPETKLVGKMFMDSQSLAKGYFSSKLDGNKISQSNTQMWGLTAYNCIVRLVFSLQLVYIFDFVSIFKAWDTCFSYK